jgi:heparosan-N-sulfate-glucuronate 5-epimerase
MTRIKIPNSYYIDLQGLEDFGYPRDSDGLPLVEYGEKTGNRYNPITISQYGFYLLNRPQYHGIAIKCADWLVDNLQLWQQDMHAWIYDFDLWFYGPRAPWISAMAQGEGISLLLRVFQLTGIEKYKETAKLAFTPFRYSVEENGVVDRIAGRSVFFEEYVTHPPSHVLNGHIFALLGVYDYWRFFNDDDAARLWQQGTNTIRQHWSRWDCGYWTWYDLYPVRRLASRMYHRLHIRLIKKLSELNEDAELSNLAGRWHHMLNHPVCVAKWLLSKTIEKIRISLLK